MDIVSALLAALAAKVGKERFELWFGPRTRIDWDGHVLTIGAANQFFLDWIRSNFRTAVEEAGLAILGRRPALEFRVEAPGQSGGAADATASPLAKPPAGCRPSTQSGPETMVSFNAKGKHDAARTAEVGAAAHTCPVAKQAEPPPTPAFSPRKFASLSSFVVGASNRLAMYSAEMVARNPGQITPLFVHGPTSVGKTHLLEGIWSAERKAGRGTTTVYLSAEQFTSQFLEALRGGGMPVFRRKYRGVQRADPRRFAVPGRKAGHPGRIDAHRRHAAPRGPAIGLRRRSAAGRIERLHAGTDHASDRRDGLPHRAARLRHAIGDRRPICRADWGSNCRPTCNASWPRG